MPHLVRATSLALDNDEPEMAADLQMTLGEQLYGLKRRAEAISPLQAAAELARMLGNGQLEARARGALLNALHSAHPDAGTALREQMLRLAELFAANADSEENAEAARAARAVLSALRADQEAAPGLASTGARWPGQRRRRQNAPSVRPEPGTRWPPSYWSSKKATPTSPSSSAPRSCSGQPGRHPDRRALLGCASALLAEGNAQESVGWFSLAADQFAACGDEANLVQAEIGRLQAFADVQKWDEVDTSRKIIEITERDATPQARAARLTALSYQVQALTAAQDHAGATHAAIQAADLAAELGERELEARLRLGARHGLRLLKRFANAADAYEQTITIIGGLPDASDWKVQALQGLGAVLRDSPQTGAERLRPLADRYAADGDMRMEALCRQELARCLERIQPAQHVECAAHYARVAKLFDRVGDAGRAGDCWYQAASAYNWLGLMHSEYRQKCYVACGMAADRFQAAGNLWGKGLAEFLAGQALRTDDPTALHDPRSLPALRRAVQSFAAAGRVVEETGSRLSVTAELCQSGTDEAWMASALLALHRYEAARAELLMPQRRRDNDRQVRWGLHFVGGCLWRAWAASGRTRRWAELAWRLEQAAKGRSFLDQHHQDKVWTRLVASDPVSRELTGKAERLTLRRDALTRTIDAADRQILHYVVQLGMICENVHPRTSGLLPAGHIVT